MARVFTITEGLENMGAIKTGGQGSVYKGRRIGEIITAIKILPTPIFSETAEDKNYVAFQSEVQKLQKVNEHPCPNVVKFLGSGITESGNFPFIEMEFIEGPDLEELLQPPHDKIFTIKEVVKVAEQLSGALAHCHAANVRHGDIKSNNVKCNDNTRNYVLLDFGLAAISEEQRRTSIRHAGAVEFMAPEQNEGRMLFQTDVYSFGVVLYELLAGSVPFRLNDKSETARNKVMVAHIETPPPDLLALRRQHLPNNWNAETKLQEMQVPSWLTGVIYKCLSKKPEDRFSNGQELHQYIVQSVVEKDAKEPVNSSFTLLQQENIRLRNENEQLRQQLLREPKTADNIVKAPDTHTKISSKTSAGRGRSSFSQVLSKRRNLIFLSILVAVALVGWYFSTSRSGNDLSQSVVKPAAPQVVVASVEPPAVRSQLLNARRFYNEGKVVEAFTIYSSLTKKEIPEAMYWYSKLALQNRNQNLNCNEAFDLLKMASDKGFAPAKRTLGFLYSFADDDEALKKANLFDRCKFQKNPAKGAALLTEAMLSGDSTAARLLDKLQLK